MLKRMAIIFAVLFCLTGMVRGQEYILKVVVEANSLPEGGKVYIAGNYPSIGGWAPDAAALDSVAPLKWEKSFVFQKGQSPEFKITGGSWAREAIYELNVLPKNFALKMEKDTTLSIFVRFWKNETEFKPVIKGQITGKVVYHKNLTYPKLLPRDVLVWLPPGYEKEEARYPVIYMQDGQNVFDPVTSTLGVDWSADEIADSLIRNGKIEKIIIVAITNTRHRYQEYTRGDTTDAYMEYTAKVIKPMIDSLYRTKPEREFTAVAGSSAGGLISFRTAWEYDNIFSKVAAISPAFKIYNIDYVTPVLEYTGVKKDLLIYIDNGGLGLEERLQPGIDEMIPALQSKGFVNGKDLFWKKFPDAMHNEQAWAERFHIPLELFFGIKK